MAISGEKLCGLPHRERHLRRDGRPVGDRVVAGEELDRILDRWFRRQAELVDELRHRSSAVQERQQGREEVRDRLPLEGENGSPVLEEEALLVTN
jgi:hypothetical protein